MMQLGLMVMQSLKLSTKTRVVNIWRNQILDHGTCPGFLSMKEIARMLGVSEARARRAMHEIRRKHGVEVMKGRPVKYRVIIEDGNGNEYLSGASPC